MRTNYECYRASVSDEPYSTWLRTRWDEFLNSRGIAVVGDGHLTAQEVLTKVKVRYGDQFREWLNNQR